MTAQKDVEALVAIGLYRAKTNALKERVRNLYGQYSKYLRPLEEVREMLSKEIPVDKRMSQDIVDLRRLETH